MKRISSVLVVSACLLTSPLAFAKHGKAGGGNDAAILAACPVEGDAKQLEARQLNPLKRRMTTPASADMDNQVTLQAMVASGDDTNRFDVKKGATIEGYVADVKVGGIESVNCHTKDPKYRDTHIELTLEANSTDQTKHVIVEVTPQWREEMAKKGTDWSTPTLRKQLLGRWIKVTGWLFFDAEHVQQAENTNPGGAKNWRATVWEIHPVTTIDVLPAKP